MNVIAKISCYSERCVVTVKLRNEYLNTVIHNTLVLLRIKNWTVWCIERYFVSTYTAVSTFQKQSGLLAHPVVFWHQYWLVGDAPFLQIFAESDPPLQKTPTSTDFRLWRLNRKI